MPVYTVTKKERKECFAHDDVPTPPEGFLSLFLGVDGEWAVKEPSGEVRPATDEDFRCLQVL